MDANKNLPPDKVCPQHFKDLQHAGPVAKKIPTLAEQLQQNEEAKALKQANGCVNNEHNRRRTTCFCIECSIVWSHSIIQTVKDKFHVQGFS